MYTHTYVKCGCVCVYIYFLELCDWCIENTMQVVAVYMEIVRPQSEEGQCHPGWGAWEEAEKAHKAGPRAETLEVSTVATQGKGAV